MKQLLLSAFLSLSCISAMAEIRMEQDTTSSYHLNEISVISFYRTDAKVGTIVSRESLLKHNKGQEPSFILSSRPSIFAYSDTGNEYGYAYFRMRGMDQTRVNMTLDGMPLNEGEDMGVYFSNYPDVIASMHSIKIESGAGITGNGVAGYAGTIDLESVNLKRDTVSSVYAGCGSFNTFKSCMEYNSGIKGKWAVHFKATQQQSDGYRDHAYNNSQSAFTKVGYFFNDHHSIEFLSFIGQSRNGQGWIGSSLDQIMINDRSNGCTEAETDRFVQNINKLQYKGFASDNVTFTASLYYNQLKGHYYFDVDNFMINVIDSSWQNTGEVDCYNLRHHMIGGNIAAKVYVRDFVLTTGLNASAFNRSHIGTNNLDTEEMWNNKGYKNDVNLFAKGEYSYNGLKVVGNIQYRHADFDYRGDVAFDKVYWDFLNWSGNVSYQFNQAHSLYASVTQTHREPTRSDMFGGEENLIEVVTTQAESVIDYELGYNATSDGCTGNLNLYYMDFSNELILNGEMGTNGLPIRENVEKSYRTGIELNLTYEPVKGLVLSNATSYSINKVETASETLNHTMSPHWLVNQSIVYGFNGFEFGVDVRYRSKMYFDLTNLYELGSSLRFGANATYTYEDFTCGVYVNNLFNERSFSNGMMSTNGPLYFIDAPRNFHVDVRWSF
ncbi:MAG: TonB-dependent receptor [Bacteroidaceae bacterium]|nr:TonB-dependent receptor [Bacteroidaceae bacterium]